ncbi:uncharacterized protein TRIREDRAFT_110764 [Trichoderma reesei QM6a]|uniref:Predicted protein n=1 Tax=Hypocrea jecorina (strain QM6a) TaxID=431241 RepID=G0RSV9_HYPJQ|nr:uncharacterized protein TRIREDRAFT_110764 [Trichoderma reesei QM6a]EGR45674.1 predicted protein [Trichoderma reesei QM6a]
MLNNTKLKILVKEEALLRQLSRLLLLLSIKVKLLSISIVSLFNNTILSKIKEVKIKLREKFLVNKKRERYINKLILNLL